MMYQGISMTMLTTKRDPNASAATPGSGQAATTSKVSADAELPRRNTALDEDEMIWDYAAIERRAQELRSEVAWNMARAIHAWAVKLFTQGKAKARAVTQAPLARQGQAT